MRKELGPYGDLTSFNKGADLIVKYIYIYLTIEVDFDHSELSLFDGILFIFIYVPNAVHCR